MYGYRELHLEAIATVGIAGDIEIIVYFPALKVLEELFKNS